MTEELPIDALLRWGKAHELLMTRCRLSWTNATKLLRDQIPDQPHGMHSQKLWHESVVLEYGRSFAANPEIRTGRI